MSIDRKVYDLSKNQVLLGGVPLKGFIPDVLVEAGEDERDADGNITGTKIGKVLEIRWSK